VDRRSRGSFCWGAQSLFLIRTKTSLLRGRITLKRIGTLYSRLPGTFDSSLNTSQVTEEEAVKTQSPVLGYNAGKKLAEQAAWDFLAVNKPVFDLTVINPDIIIGPMLQPIDSPKHVNETNAFACYDFFNGKYKDVENLRFPFYHFVRPVHVFSAVY